MISILISQVGRYKWVSVLTPVFTATEVVLDVLIPYITASLIDKGLMAGNIQEVYSYGALMLLMAFLSLAFGILAGQCSAMASTGFAANLRRAMYRNIQTFSFADIDRFSTSGLVTRMTSDVTSLQNAYGQILRVSVRAPFRLILSIVMCMMIDARLSLIFIVAMIVLSTSLYSIISRVARLFKQVFRQYDALNQSVQENIAAIRVVKAFVREGHEQTKFSQAAERLYNLYVRAESLMALNHPVMNMVVYGCIIALSWYGAHFIVGGTLTTGELTSLFTYVMSILQSLMMLSMVFVMLTQSAASAERVAEVIEAQTSIANPEQAVTSVPDGSIEFRSVRFDYTATPAPYTPPAKKPAATAAALLSPAPQRHKRSALFNVSFEIRSGETIGVIGGTGSGKSSLVSLINRLYDVTQGSVIVGGHDVRDYDLTTLRDAVAVVLQQNTLFSGTILDNLRWGRADATLDECRKACCTAAADEFISQMPNAYNSRIEQGGTNLSGGQRQRLCIARALLKRPHILILDDSTSACDTATDAAIRRGLRTALPGTTKLIIAQRILSVRDCDRILVLDNGQLAGFDTHERLLQANAVYREIYDLQMANAGDFDAPAIQKGGAS